MTLDHLDNDKEELRVQLWSALRTDKRADTYVIPTRVMELISEVAEAHTQSKLKAFAGEVLDIVEAEYQKCSTLGRINEDGIRKLYVQSEYRHKVVKAIKGKAGIE